MQATAPITYDDQVTYLGRTWTVAYINFNARQCPAAGHGHCSKLDLRCADGLDKQGIRECQVTPTPAPSGPVEGDVIGRRTVNGVTVAIVYVGGPHRAYRVSIRHASTQAEVGDLSFSLPTVDAARRSARKAVAFFALGVTIQQALDAQPNYRTLLDLAA